MDRRDKRLNVAFVWHMHQPLYKDPLTGEYVMPWVLLHATKDYFDMAAILEEFPAVHQTFNVVPCLIEQINDYASGRVNDAYRNVTLKPAAGLDKDDKLFLLKNFFQANWENMIRPIPGYWELLCRRGPSNSPDDIRQALRYFSVQDYLDLQIYFNLAWIDPWIRSQDAELGGLLKKGRSYAEEDKQTIVKKQTAIAAGILRKYAELSERGIIELSTTPYYHPIMPLLYDSFSAKAAMPDVILPKERFSHPEDVRAQLEKGVRLHEETFGMKPAGMWPSEGSVSHEILPLIRQAGIKWIASDEEILSNSLKRPLRRDTSGNCHDAFLYKPYAVDVNGERLSIVFRDHMLSDLIGFDYAKMNPDDAADDFIRRLTHIHGLFEEPEKQIVSIILDGENAWENFINDGRDFLRALYSKLSDHPQLKCVTVGEFLDSAPYREELKWLYPGSWISHNFKIWIGHHEDNAAWDYIAEARSALVRFEETLAPDTLTAEKKFTPPLQTREGRLKEAWSEIYAAEGSDWFWWYGDDHSSQSDEQFDVLFRKHLKKAYLLMGKEPPMALDIPISSEEKGFKPASTPTAFIKPVIDGDVTNYFEWLAAGRLERIMTSSSMHKDVQKGCLLDAILYGFSRDSIFFRLDYLPELIPYEKDWKFTINIVQPSCTRISAGIKGGSPTVSVYKKQAKVEPPQGIEPLQGEDEWVAAGVNAAIASGCVVELGLRLDDIDVRPAGEIRFFINIEAGERCVERWPSKGVIIIDAPSADFEDENWLV
ncbi:MAG: hypothetical protein HZB82_00280 [Deltaproteobacteria bacterium]|nr:hypothetical protein [Deltaproteobacteria bacterium]